MGHYLNVITDKQGMQMVCVPRHQAELVKVPIHFQMPKIKYCTERDTVTRQVCEEIHSRVECRNIFSQVCKHEPEDMRKHSNQASREDIVTTIAGDD